MPHLSVFLTTPIIVVLGFFVWRFRGDSQQLQAGLSVLRVDYERLQSEHSALADQATVMRSRLSGIVDLEAELSAMRVKLDEGTREQQDFESKEQDRRTKLNEEYAQARARYDGLKTEVAVLEENIEDMSFGLYQPHFTFQTPEEYKTALRTCVIRKGC